MAEDMLDIALTKGSKDNISAVVAILQGYDASDKRQMSIVIV